MRSAVAHAGPSSSSTPRAGRRAGRSARTRSARAAIPSGALLGGEVRRMDPPDAVLVADRPAVGDDRLAGQRLEPAPAVERLVRVGGQAEGVGHVQARAARVQVRQVAVGVDPFAVGPRARAGGPGQALRRGPAAGPSRPRSRACPPHSRRPQRIAQVGRAQPLTVPGRARATAPRCRVGRARAARPRPPTARTTLSGPGHARRARGRPRRLLAAPAEVPAEQSARPIRRDERDRRRRLDGGRDADHRQLQARRWPAPVRRRAPVPSRAGCTHARPDARESAPCAGPPR